MLWYPAKGPADAAAFVRAAGFQFEAQAELIGGETAGGQTRGQSVDQSGQQKGQRLQQLHWIIQLDLVFEIERLCNRKQFAIAFAARQFAQAQSLRSRAAPRCRAAAAPPFPGSAGCPSAPEFPAIGALATAASAERAREICLRRHAESGSRRRIHGQRRWPHRDCRPAQDWPSPRIRGRGAQ